MGSFIKRYRLWVVVTSVGSMKCLSDNSNAGRMGGEEITPEQVALMEQRWVTQVEESRFWEAGFGCGNREFALKT